MTAACRLLLCLAVVVVGATGGAAPLSAQPFPAPGRMIDVGGWRLHLHCTLMEQLQLEVQVYQ